MITPETISRLSQHYLQTISGGIDYQNSNIKKVGGTILKQICKINILAHDTGAENEIFKKKLKFEAVYYGNEEEKLLC